MIPDDHNIVVVGSGYGGITAVLRLAKLFRSSPTVQVHLVDKNPYHTLKTQLHEAAINKRDVTIDIGRVLRKHNIVFHLGTVSAIDPVSSTVHFDHQSIRYSYLILALGSQANYYKIPGLQHHAFSLQNASDAERIYKHISNLCAGASSERDSLKRQKMLCFVIGGGGLSGIEFAAELADHIRHSIVDYRLNENEVEILIVESAEEILPSLDRSLRERVSSALSKKKIIVRTNTRIIGASDQMVSLSSGDVIATSTIIWTGGIKSTNLIGESGLMTDSLGRLKVDPFLRSIDFPNIFAIGDNAFVINPQTGDPVPAAAQFALQQGKLAAENLYALTKGRHLLPYRPKVIGEVISLGRHLAVGWLALPLMKKIEFFGFLARLLKTAIHEKHIILLTKASRNWTKF